MSSLIAALEAFFSAVPLDWMELWGGASYAVGIALMIAAFGGFTLRVGERWRLGREQHAWDEKALLSIPLTFTLIFVTGYAGSWIVLVPGAQTFESLKDLAVLLCIALLGYPALLAVPPAYMLSDLIEGVPPAFLQDWFVGYFVNPACFWVAYQMIGADPDFRRARTWGRYLAFVAFFMSVEPQLWGHICAEQFTPEISYRRITPALFFTTAVTWALAPAALLGALPLARRCGLFWAQIPGRVRRRALGQSTWEWESGPGPAAPAPSAAPRALPLRIFLAIPLLGLVLLMAGAVAYLALQRGRDAATALAVELQRASSRALQLELDAALRAGLKPGELRSRATGELLARARAGERGRAFLIDRQGLLVASSAAPGAAGSQAPQPGADAAAGQAAQSADPVVREAARALAAAGLRALRSETRLPFEVVTEKPLGRETWLAQVTPYALPDAGADWLMVVALAEAEYLGDVRTGHSEAAMVIAVALLVSLLAAPLLAGAVAAPILRVARSAHAIAAGDLSARVAASRLEELDEIAASFNYMAGQLQHSRRQMEADLHRRAEIERALRESEEHLEELVARRTEALAAANRELEAFSYSVSHDLRAPLRAINGFAKLLAEEHGARLGAGGHEYLERIWQASAKMSQLIDGLLDLGRLGRCELKMGSVDLSALADDVVLDLRVGDPGREVEMRIQPGLRADADPRLLRQVLQNLIGNAWKFTARSAAARIEFGGAASGGEETFYVADNGAGFDMAFADKLFGVFQRLHRTEEFEGTGVGLALVERIVRRHGGRVWAEGAVGRGATVHFTLPGPPGSS